MLFDGAAGGGVLDSLVSTALRLNESGPGSAWAGGSARGRRVAREDSAGSPFGSFFGAQPGASEKTIAMTQQASDNQNPLWAEPGPAPPPLSGGENFEQLLGAGTRNFQQDFLQQQQQQENLTQNSQGNNFQTTNNIYHHNSNHEQSFSDWWQEYWSRQPFPSGYTQSSITLLACLITTIIFLIVVGNLLVCIAIFTEKSLKPTQNWFIASLAVSDMLLGLVVMPFSLARELMGFWIFGPLWCDIHEALDVLLSTASINTLCLISLDRYWSITQAVSYLKKRTPRRGALMIAFVWVFSAAVSLPPLFGWKKQSPSSAGGQVAPSSPNSTTSESQAAAAAAAEAEAPLPPGQDAGQPTAAELQWRHRSRRRRKARPSRFEPQDEDEQSDEPEGPPEPGRAFIPSRQQVTHYAYLLQTTQTQLPQQQIPQQQQQQQQISQQASMANEYPTCQLSDDVGYVLYSALGSFYIPCAVMVFTYIKIFLAARSRARRAINKQARAAHNQTGGQASGKRAGGRPATIAGTTGGRGAAKQQLMSAAGGPGGDSTLLLTTTTNNTTTRITTNGQHRSESPTCDEHPQQQQQHFHARHRASVAQVGGGGGEPGPGVMKGKLVVIERRKSTVSSQVAAAVAAPPGARGPEVCEPAHQVAPPKQQQQVSVIMTTSGAPRQASPSSALNASASCAEGLSSAQPQQQQLGQPASRKPTSESNDSSLITVMSASMTDLPQVTRFNFRPGPGEGPATPPSNPARPRADPKAAALLQAFSRAAHELSEENLVKQMEAEEEAAAADGELVVPAGNHSASNQGEQNHSTNETCFMTIEEDSDNFESQTGRTIMMIASTARHSSAGLAACKSPVGMMMTMQPAAGGPDTAESSPRAVCTNAACLRRFRRRRRRRGAHHASSYCDSSMTIDDEDDDDLEADEDEEDEADEDEDDDDECLDDELLSDECNGYSGGSCGALDQYCADSPSCVACRECAALVATRPNERHDESPASCAGNRSSPGQLDSPRLATCADHQQRAAATTARRRHNCHHAGRTHRHPHLNQHHGGAHNHQARAGPATTTCSETENQSLTGDDNLSLTDYYRSNEDNSSIVGHDVLDATPAEPSSGRHSRATSGEHNNKRRSIVASAIASMGGGLKGMTSPSAAQQREQSQQAVDGQSPSGDDAGLVGRKKSSIGFHLARFAGSGAPSQAGGGLLALAAQQQQSIVGQQQASSNQPRNLKTLRQNFFQKLNQLTAKSAAKQAAAANRSPSRDGAKSSAQSSYGSSYEPSVDYATTSNVHSNEHYNQETTFGETDDLYAEQQGGDAKQSGELGGRSSKLLSIAQQTAKQQMSGYQAAAAAAALAASDNQSRAQAIRGPNFQQQPQAQLAADPGASQLGKLGGGDDERAELDRAAATDASNAPSCNNLKALERDNRAKPTSAARQADGTPATGGEGALAADDQLALIGKPNNMPKGGGGGATKRRSNDKGTLATVGSSQGSGSDQQRTVGITSGGGGGASNTNRGPNNNNSTGASRAYLASDNERHKRKLAKARERRATLILGLIMAAFVCSWLPFFTFYVIRAVCHVCRDYISPRFEAFIFWMGYCNSAINPIIYTIFNRDFRKAFRKILFKCL